MADRAGRESSSLVLGHGVSALTTFERPCSRRSHVPVTARVRAECPSQLCQLGLAQRLSSALVSMKRPFSAAIISSDRVTRVLSDHAPCTASIRTPSSVPTHAITASSSPRAAAPLIARGMRCSSASRLSKLPVPLFCSDLQQRLPLAFR